MLNGVPEYFQADAVVGLSKPVSHAAYVAPGLVRHQHCGLVAETMGGLADTLQASLDAITTETVGRKGMTVHSGQISFDPACV